MRTAYTHELRSIECPKCGAPVVAPPTAADVTCTYCGTLQRLAARRSLAPEPTAIDEQSRLASLRLQFAQQSPARPTLFRIPEGLEPYLAMLHDRAARPAALAAIRRDWEQTRARMAEAPDREEGLRLFRLAYFLSMFYTLDDDHPHSRAVLETALELVVEPEHADILRSSLARLALDQGDEDAYRAWLAEINPRPLLLEADSSFRVTVARDALRRGDFRRVLDLLGPNYGEVPFSAEISALASCLRAHAQAGSQQANTCTAEIEGMIARHGNTDVQLLFQKNPGPATPYVEAAARRVGTAGRRGLAGSPVGRAIGCTTGLTVLVTTVLPAVLGLSAAVYPYPWFHLAGSPNAYEVALEKVRACPAARARLGDDIGGTVGWGCGGCEMGGGSGTWDWNVPVSGSRGRGQLYFHGVQSSGRWSVTSASLELDGGAIDLVACVPNAVEPSPFPGVLGPGAGTTTTTTTTTTTVDVGSGQGADLVQAVLDQQCSSGNAGACFSLGSLYEHGGAGLPVDRERARQYYQRACEAGQQAACTRRDSLR